MDSFDRIYAALKGKPVDRPPVFPQIGDHAGIINLLPSANPREVENAVEKAINDSGGNPRYMVAPVCEITSEIPIDNVKALVNAAKSSK